MQCDLTAVDRQVQGLSLGSSVCVSCTDGVCELVAQWDRQQVLYSAQVILSFSLWLCLSDKHTHTNTHSDQQQSGPLAFLHLT